MCQTAGATLWVPESLNHLKLKQIKFYSGSLKDHIASLWFQNRALVFCLATGAVVRLIAPLLEDKSRDPAIVVVEQGGRFVISLCSSHQRGANQLAQLVAHQLGAVPILTGAAADLGIPGIDVLGIPFGWLRGEGNWTGVSAAAARGESIEVIQEAGSILWQSHLKEGHPFEFGASGDSKARIWISSQVKSPQASLEIEKGKGEGVKVFKNKNSIQNPLLIPEVQWHPRVLWVGIGCERGTSKELLVTAIEQTCQRYQLATAAIAAIATIDLKADEVGLVELCAEHNWPLRTFPAEVLGGVSVPNPSRIVKKEVGTPSVAEAAALLAASSQTLLVSKQIFRSQSLNLDIAKLEGDNNIHNYQGAVTVAIAQSELEYTGRNGQLFLVGTGPGQLDQMTPAAQTAVTKADAVIGYSLYIDLITALRRPGQIIEALPITKERQRAQRAIELAEWGLSVAVISSGDCGIYGMAGLVFEELRNQGWDGKKPEIQLFPGISALQAAASRVGAPLMHDFCAISLSDLLTPWKVIEKRLEAAAQADFVTALYNPQSRKRTQQIAIAQDIFLKYRHPHTPVAIVRSAYREDEQVTLTTLDKFLDLPIDMLSTVLIGNQSTDIYSNWMITPRGYLG
ncbi:MAG: precorrin-3B C(17)-methyltransferase [Symploca sp. SIO1C4]|uniref:Precorrin-3B C(17)-methyltransferase n=1 Tax=Symploca sp. SIO1C4 TaxID=2607765 RepID=A0A6B3NCC3_9CYAN|nr:precorrin-3B C(17)-methyltransferase [Symploca sp. SIO1C4]